MDRLSLLIKQAMARYLRKRGWVAFYLEPMFRECNEMCWLHLYEEEMRKELADD